MEYRVTWEIDVRAKSPRAAAREALRIQRDLESIATVFSVRKIKNAKTMDSAFVRIFPDDEVIDMSKSRKRRKRLANFSGMQRSVLMRLSGRCVPVVEIGFVIKTTPSILAASEIINSFNAAQAGHIQNHLYACRTRNTASAGGTCWLLRSISRQVRFEKYQLRGKHVGLHLRRT